MKCRDVRARVADCRATQCVN